MTLEDLRQRSADAERRAVLAELDAIDAALAVLEQQLGPDDVIAETRQRAHAVRVRWLASGQTVVH